MKSVLWIVAKRLSYIQDARCLKVNIISPSTLRYSQQSVSFRFRHQNLVGVSVLFRHSTFSAISSPLFLHFNNILTSKPMQLLSVLFLHPLHTPHPQPFPNCDTQTSFPYKAAHQIKTNSLYLLTLLSETKPAPTIRYFDHIRNTSFRTPNAVVQCKAHRMSRTFLI